MRLEKPNNRVQRLESRVSVSECAIGQRVPIHRRLYQTGVEFSNSLRVNDKLFLGGRGYQPGMQGFERVFRHGASPQSTPREKWRPTGGDRLFGLQSLSAMRFDLRWNPAQRDDDIVAGPVQFDHRAPDQFIGMAGDRRRVVLLDLRR